MLQARAFLLQLPMKRACGKPQVRGQVVGVAGVLGVFLARDLLFFFVCYEVMLLPVFALIIRWGAGDARRVAMRFFVFTQTGGLLMFISILGLYVAHINAGGKFWLKAERVDAYVAYGKVRRVQEPKPKKTGAEDAA